MSLIDISDTWSYLCITQWLDLLEPTRWIVPVSFSTLIQLFTVDTDEPVTLEILSAVPHRPIYPTVILQFILQLFCMCYAYYSMLSIGHLVL